MRVELQEAGKLGTDQKTFSVLAHRSDMTGADREWAARYKAGDILKYEKGSKAHGIPQNSTAVVLSSDARNNTVTVQQDGGKAITYDPKRLKGVNAYTETHKQFATGDRIQFTAKDKELGVSNRDLGTITKLETGQITVQMDGKTERIVQFDPAKDEALRPRLCRNVPRLARTYRGPGYRQHRHRFGPVSYQYPACLCRGLACGARREDLHQRCRRAWSAAGNRCQQDLSRGLSTEFPRPSSAANTASSRCARVCRPEPPPCGGCALLTQSILPTPSSSLKTPPSAAS